MKLKDLPDDFTPAQFRQLDRESLDAVPYVRRRWLCQCKGCTNGTHVRDYGLVELNGLGIWAWLDRNSKNSRLKPSEYWMGPNNYWLCGKHNKLFKRLESIYGIEHTWNRLIDTSKIVVVAIPGADELATVKPIEQQTPIHSPKNHDDGH